MLSSVNLQICVHTPADITMLIGNSPAWVSRTHVAQIVFC